MNPGITPQAIAAAASSVGAAGWDDADDNTDDNNNDDAIGEEEEDGKGLGGKQRRGVAMADGTITVGMVPNVIGIPGGMMVVGTGMRVLVAITVVPVKVGEIITGTTGKVAAGTSSRSSSSNSTCSLNRSNRCNSSSRHHPSRFSTMSEKHQFVPSMQAMFQSALSDVIC